MCERSAGKLVRLGEAFRNFCDRRLDAIHRHCAVTSEANQPTLFPISFSLPILSSMAATKSNHSTIAPKCVANWTNAWRAAAGVNSPFAAASI
jgi:hypothetical protein